MWILDTYKGQEMLKMKPQATQDAHTNSNDFFFLQKQSQEPKWAEKIEERD